MYSHTIGESLKFNKTKNKLKIHRRRLTKTKNQKPKNEKWKSKNERKKNALKLTRMHYEMNGFDFVVTAAFLMCPQQLARKWRGKSNTHFTFNILHFYSNNKKSN